MTQQLEETQQLTGVAETLMITLYARVVETQRSDRLLQDPKAVEIAQSVDYDFSKYQKGWASQLGVVIRVRGYDSLVKDFLETHPGAVVINLGCGLCTRFTRIDTGEVHWYEVDFPEVIELRRKFFQESDRYQFIPTSILDFTWMDQIHREPHQPLLIVMEGVSPYLTEAENRAIVTQIRDRFGGSTVGDRVAPTEIFFDVLNRKSAKNTKGHDTVSKTNAEFKSGMDSGKEVETWGSGIILKDELYYLPQFADHPDRLPLWARFLIPVLAPIFKNSARVLHLQLTTCNSQNLE
jgi:O-methyltransferase involved in polyketide biosynthesis